GRTGELALDVTISGVHDAVLTAISLAISVVLGPVVGPLLLLVAGVLVATRNRAAAIVLVVTTIIAWLSVGVGKVIYARQRPPGAQLHALSVELGRDSFPSGHVAFAVAVAGGAILALHVAARPTRWAWILGVALAVTVAASRLYLGVHYLGDVVASFLFAGGTMLVLSAVVVALDRHRLLPGTRRGDAALSPGRAAEEPGRPRTR
ncbi:MAG: phosphatase PAP2 family protein, partial [Mycobacteriaceae bacterium]